MPGDEGTPEGGLARAFSVAQGRATGPPLLRLEAPATDTAAGSPSHCVA